MLRRILLPGIFLVLAWIFWASPHIKEIAAGVAIFLFGMLSLEQGFKAFTGGVLEKLLRVSTDRLWKTPTPGGEDQATQGVAAKSQEAGSGIAGKIGEGQGHRPQGAL